MPLLQVLYGKHAAALYAQAADFNKTSRFYYMKAEDAYYLANAQASFDDWRRSRKQVILRFYSLKSFVFMAPLPLVHDFFFKLTLFELCIFSTFTCVSHSICTCFVSHIQRSYLLCTQVINCVWHCALNISVISGSSQLSCFRCSDFHEFHFLLCYVVILP
jgi:hypothetical protein